MARTKQTARVPGSGSAVRPPPPMPVEEESFTEERDDEDLDEDDEDDEDLDRDANEDDGDGGDDDDQASQITVSNTVAVTDGSPASPKKVYADPGTLIESRNLYPGPKDKDGRWVWTTVYPTDLDKPVENKASAQYALLVRRQKCYDGRKQLEIHSIVVQSQLIKDALGQVLKGYPGITTNLARLEFHPPFTPLMHRWAKLEDAVNNETDSKKKSHIQLLYKVIEPEMRELIDQKTDLLSNGVMTFDLLYTMFEPGSMVYSYHDDHHRIFRTTDCSYGADACGNRFLNIGCEFVDFDGVHFGYDRTNLSIGSWRGTKPVTKLSTIPLSFVSDVDRKKQIIRERGLLFEKFAGYHFKQYDGVAIDPGCFGPIRYPVDSRIIVDANAYNKFQPNRRINLTRIYPVMNNEEAGATDEDSEDYDEAVKADSKTTKPTMPQLTEDQRLLCVHTVRGYSLRDKKWLTFYLNGIKDVEWNEHAFTSLVAPPEQKELILAFAQSQAESKHDFDDVIQGKGRGIVMLLSGPPGVGKTLTAESVAEAMKVPLYTMSAGDLGTDPHTVESNLKNILELSTKWNAVLLLDEADVFLEARSTSDLERNKLVSIFLRLLEYYEGILFLTTNRVDNIDAAFESRIHLSLDYPELDVESRKTVWRNFLTKGITGNVSKDITEEEIATLAEAQLNGRQIKNIIKTSHLLASKKGEKLGYKHIQIVVNLRNANARGIKRVKPEVQ